MSAISIHHLTMRYGAVEAVSDLSLDVPSGSLFGFLGPNGAGTTTTSKIRLGRRRRPSGQYEDRAPADRTRTKHET